MAHNALKILKSGGLFKEMKQNAVEHAQKFSMEKILPRYEKCYEAVLSEVPKRRS
jgi:hypothetical protein